MSLFNPPSNLPPRSPSLMDLDMRARDIFRHVVESYLETGDPVGSRTLSKGGVALSPASIRNTMQDLTQLGLLTAPHLSAGRIPTHAGLRLFVDGLLEVGDLSEEERREIDHRLAGRQALQAIEATARQQGHAASGFTHSPIEQRVMAAGNGRGRGAFHRPIRRKFGVLGQPAIDQLFRKQPFAGHPGAGDLLGPDELVDLAPLEAQVGCHLIGVHHLIWGGLPGHPDSALPGASLAKDVAVSNPGEPVRRKTGVP